MQPHFISVYSDIGAGKHGTTHGVQMIADRTKARFANASFCSIVADYQKQTPLHPAAKYIENLLPFFTEKLVPQLSQELQTAEQNNHFPVIISGDHSNAMGNLAAFRNHHKDAKVGVVWIDAHADLHSIFTTPSGNMHGMPLAASLDLDNKQCQQANPDDIAQQKWQQLKNLAVAKNFSTENLYFLGLRSYESPEESLLNEHQIFAYSAKGDNILNANQNLPLDEILSILLAQLQGLDAIYISFDIDALDAVFVPATGTPEPQGYTPDEVRQIFNALFTLPNIKLFEITEFNPTLDDDRQKHQAIFDLFDDVLTLIEQR